MALLASAGLHVLIALPLRDSLGQFLLGKPTGPRPPVRVVELSPEQWSQNARTSGRVRPSENRPHAPSAAVAAASPNATPTPTPSPSPSPSPENERPTGQVVDVPPTADETADPSARFLSRVNSKVEKETSARLDQRDRKLGQVTPKLQREGTEADAPPRPKPRPSRLGDDRADDRAARPEEQRMVLKVPEILRQEGLDIPELPGSGRTITRRRHIAPLRGEGRELDVQLGKEDAAAAEEAGRAGAKEGTGDRPVPSLSALMPSLGTLDRITGSPREADVDGVEEGDATFLNAKEFKFATFYLRMRESIADQWEDAVVREYRRRDPSGHLYGTRDRTTLLHVTIKSGGELVGVQVEETSGVDFLDSVAVDSMWRAQPFPNPPTGIVDQDGLIRLSFSFRLVVGAQNPFQFRGFAPQQ